MFEYWRVRLVRTILQAREKFTQFPLVMGRILMFIVPHLYRVFESVKEIGKIVLLKKVLVLMRYHFRGPMFQGRTRYGFRAFVGLIII